MKTVFRKLFTVQLMHDFYNASPVFDDLEIVPDDETKKFLARNGMVWKCLSNQFIAGIEVNDDDKPRTVPDSGTVIRLLLKIKNSSFYQFTALNQFNSAGKIFYFTNKAKNLNDNRLYLSQPVAAYDSSKDYEMGEIVSSPGFLSEAIQFQDSHAHHETNEPLFWRPLENERFAPYDPAHHDSVNSGSIVFNTADNNLYEALEYIPSGISISMTPPHFQKVNSLQYVSSTDLVSASDFKVEKNVMGIIDLFFRSVPSDYRLLDNNQVVRQLKYVLRFKNRISTWKYFSKRFAVTSITDSDGNFVISRAVGSSSEIPFTSSKPIGLLKQPFYDFQLKTSSQTINKIPVASDVKLDPSTKSFYSEIFLNY